MEPMTITHNNLHFRVEHEPAHFDYPLQDGITIDVYRSGYDSATNSNSPAAELFRDVHYRNVAYEGQWNRDHDATEKCATVTNRLLKMSGDSTRVFPHSTHGYSQSDWADILVVLDSPEEWTAPAEAAENIAREWEQWARGDVWIVTELERDAAAHFAICEPDSECECWTDTDNSCGFIIADSPAEAVRSLV